MASSLTGRRETGKDGVAVVKTGKHEIMNQFDE